MNNSTTFSLSYDGQALANHEIDVKDLAPALLALGELFEELNAFFNREKAAISVNIKATKEGSVIVELHLLQSLAQQASTLFNSDGVNAVLNTKDLLVLLLGGGGSSTGLLALIKWAKNRKPKSATRLEIGKIKLELEDGDAKIIEENEFQVF